MFVKICGITNEDDALFAVAMGADAVGFIFAPSKRQVAAQQVYDITRRLPREILTVGVFRDEHPDRVVDIVQRAGLKAAQLHGFETPSMVREVASQVRWVIKVVVAGTNDAVRADQFGTDLIMVEGPNPGSGEVFDWTLFDDLPEGPRYILAGGLDPRQRRTGRRVGATVGCRRVERCRGSPVARIAEGQGIRREARAASPEPHIGPDELPYDWADE